MVAQLSRSSEIIRSNPNIMDPSWSVSGLGVQAPVLGDQREGAAYALPHLPQLGWQQRARGQTFPSTYAALEPLLPPPIPPGMPAPAAQAAMIFPMTPTVPAEIPVPPSLYGESNLGNGGDIEAATPGGRTGWPAAPSPSQAQQQGLELAMLTASMQSMAMSLQQLMTENRRLSEQMQELHKQKHDPKPEEEPGAQVGGSGGEPEVRRPLIGAFDGTEAPKEETAYKKDHGDPDELEDIDKKDVALPVKYKGDVNPWRHWYLKFSSFLKRRDHRWGSLLEEIRQNSQNPIQLRGRGGDLREDQCQCQESSR